MTQLQLFFGVATPIALFFGISITFAPVRWARLFGWPLPPAGQERRDERNLTLYFARCLGVTVLAFALIALRAAFDPRGSRLFLWFGVLMGTGLTLVHIFGALRRAQPASETWEILMYGGMTIWGAFLLAYPS
ncbi:MAG: hypothetical protein KC609_23255 [Myxococcales bacterium]|nr:hypothetical protein [Myxococcales bacterium]